LIAARVEIKRGRIRHIATCVVRNHRDVITDLVLIRIAFGRVKWSAHRNVRRPCYPGVGAEGIEELRICVVSRVSRVVPDSIKPPIGRY